MVKKIQLQLTEEAWAQVELVYKQVKEEYKSVCISYSDIICEMILTSKVDLKNIQAKYTNIRKSLRDMSSMKDLDLDLAIKNLIELKTKVAKRSTKQQVSVEESDNEK